MTEEKEIKGCVFQTYCGVRTNGTPLPHMFINKRIENKRHGHDPGYVYLLYLPKGKYEDRYKIGKAEYTKVCTDDFSLDKIDKELIEEIHRRLKNFHPGKGRWNKDYDGAQFIHGIRVACGHGGESQAHYNFRKKKDKKGREVFDLSDADKEVFKTATGCVLGHPIKHLTAVEFADYLLTKGLDRETIREWVVLPDFAGFSK